MIAVDTDIDARNGNAILWALAFRCRPQRDLRVLPHKDEGHGPRSRLESEDAAVLEDAVLKETLAPIALPKREYMEAARKIWDELGLPALKPQGDAGDLVRERARSLVVRRFHVGTSANDAHPTMPDIRLQPIPRCRFNYGVSLALRGGIHILQLGFICLISVGFSS